MQTPTLTVNAPVTELEKFKVTVTFIDGRVKVYDDLLASELEGGKEDPSRLIFVRGETRTIVNLFGADEIVILNKRFLHYAK